MARKVRWQPFGIPPGTWENVAPDQSTQVVNLTTRRLRGDPAARSGTWLRCAMLALGLLAAAAAAVSFEAQYRMVFTAKGIQWAAALEAAIPDAAALVFASLAIALALHGKRAIRARVLNVASVATSIGMNLLAATPGWRNLAIWIMPPIAYALASDTAIGVIRAWALARERELGEALAEDESTPLAIVSGLMLWTLRLALAPRSTLRGFRTWVVEECPVAPGRREIAVAPVAALPSVEPVVEDTTGEQGQGLSPICIAPGLLGICGSDLPCPSHGDTARSDKPDPSGPERPGRRRQPSGESKTARFLQLVQDRHGQLAAIDPAQVSRIATDLAPEVDLHPGSARSTLRPLVLAAQNGHSS